MASRLDQHYLLHQDMPRARSATAPYTKSQVNPPPPLTDAAARIRQQTLGPVFSDEEDGDDSEYVAMRMQQMSMVQAYGNTSLAAAQMHQLQLQQHALALQQQYLLQQALSQQQAYRGQPGIQDTYTHQQQLQQLQMQIQLQAHMRQVDPRVQAHLLSQLQARPSASSTQSDLQSHSILAQARLQAQVLATAQAQAMTQQTSAKHLPKDSDKDCPSPGPEKAAKTHSTSESKPTMPLGRFAQARQAASSPFGELTALLARRSAEDPQPSTTGLPSVYSVDSASATQSLSDDRLAARQALQSLGVGRPLGGSASARAKSNPFPLSPSVKAELPAARAVSYQVIKPIRQPLGPPAPTNELGDRNFQAMARKKAGKGLEMLCRRGEGQGSETGSPVVA